MKLDEYYKLLLESYYGIDLIDEYDLKVYVLKEIEELMNDFKNRYDIDTHNILNYVKNDVSDKLKLQSSLIVLNQINGPIELILLIKNRLKEINKEIIW